MGSKPSRVESHLKSSVCTLGHKENGVLEPLWQRVANGYYRMTVARDHRGCVLKQKFYADHRGVEDAFLGIPFSEDMSPV